MMLYFRNGEDILCNLLNVLKSFRSDEKNVNKVE